MTSDLRRSGSLTATTEVVVYGAGGFGRWVVEACRGEGLVVSAVMDRDPGATASMGTISIEEASDRLAGSTVILGVFSPQPDLLSIAADLRSAGFVNVVSPPSFFTWLSHRGVEADRYWLTTDLDLYRRDGESIRTARGLLSDEESVSIYDSLLAYRQSGDPESCPLPRPLSEQHTGRDFGFLPKEPGVVVDCGAFTGDTIANWAAADLQHDEILALEPDPHSFPALLHSVTTGRLRVIPLPIGVSEFTGRFSVEGEGASARLVADPVGLTMAMSLDDLLAARSVTLIKMDIEGGEAAALRGAVRTLRRHRPRLAISVYHKPWHLWSVALWLHEHVGSYEYRIRVYGHQGYDTVLYAIPQPVY